jgi:hypothetical protein
VTASLHTETSRHGTETLCCHTVQAFHHTVEGYHHAETLLPHTVTSFQHTVTLSLHTGKSFLHTETSFLHAWKSFLHTEKSFLYAGKSSYGIILSQKQAKNGQNRVFCRSNRNFQAGTKQLNSSQWQTTRCRTAGKTAPLMATGCGMVI